MHETITFTPLWLASVSSVRQCIILHPTNFHCMYLDRRQSRNSFLFWQFLIQLDLHTSHYPRSPSIFHTHAHISLSLYLSSHLFLNFSFSLLSSISPSFLLHNSCLSFSIIMYHTINYRSFYQFFPLTHYRRAKSLYLWPLSFSFFDSFHCHLNLDDKFILFIYQPKAIQSFLYSNLRIKSKKGNQFRRNFSDVKSLGSNFDKILYTNSL